MSMQISKLSAQMKSFNLLYASVSSPSANQSCVDPALRLRNFSAGYGDTLGQYLMDKGADSSIRNNNGMVGDGSEVYIG